MRVQIPAKFIEVLKEEARADIIREIEETARGHGLCNCDDQGVPVRSKHHCECLAVMTAASLLGAYSLTIHAEQCQHGTEFDEAFGQPGSPE